MQKILKSIFFLSIILNSCSLPNATPPQNLTTEQDDYLIYYAASYSGPRELMLYDPEGNTSTKILPDWIIDDFSVSVTNKLAFTTSQDAESKIYVVDYPYSENPPVDITPVNSKENTPLSWSPDGHYLLFESVQPDTNKMLVWDGKHISDIHHYYENIGTIAWGPDRQLAFSVSSEVFFWDENAVVNVSQNPSGYDGSPEWSKDGKLAFFSEHAGEFDIFVWDGVSKENGMPDKKTFVNVAPNLTHYYSYPTWTDAGSLAFEGSGAWDITHQIYEWDGRRVTNISNNQFYQNGGETWRGDGYWAFVTYVSDVTGHNVYVRNAKNHTVLSTKGRYAPAWSPSGLLIFCVEDDSSTWILSMWDGNKVIEIAHAELIVAKWKNGADVICSHG